MQRTVMSEIVKWKERLDRGISARYGRRAACEFAGKRRL